MLPAHDDANAYYAGLWWSSAVPLAIVVWAIRALRTIFMRARYQFVDPHTNSIAAMVTGRVTPGTGQILVFKFPNDT